MLAAAREDPEIQRGVCALYARDYAVLGFERPKACLAPDEGGGESGGESGGEDEGGGAGGAGEPYPWHALPAGEEGAQAWVPRAGGKGAVASWVEAAADGWAASVVVARGLSDLGRGGGAGKEREEEREELGEGEELGDGRAPKPPMRLEPLPPLRAGRLISARGARAGAARAGLSGGAGGGRGGGVGGRGAARG